MPPRTKTSRDRVEISSLQSSRYTVLVINKCVVDVVLRCCGPRFSGNTQTHCYFCNGKCLVSISCRGVCERQVPSVIVNVNDEAPGEIIDPVIRQEFSELCGSILMSVHITRCWKTHLKNPFLSLIYNARIYTIHIQSHSNTPAARLPLWYLSIIMNYEKNSIVPRLTPSCDITTPRPLYDIHFNVIHPNARHEHIIIRNI